MMPTLFRVFGNPRSTFVLSVIQQNLITNTLLSINDPFANNDTKLVGNLVLRKGRCSILFFFRRNICNYST